MHRFSIDHILTLLATVATSGDVVRAFDVATSVDDVAR
jgi:hypothetical protein